jgi:hypothetical protein
VEACPASRGVPIKDREKTWELADDVRLFYRRSSAHPVEYAITLRVLRTGRWRTIHLFDNSHAVEEHHEHRYVGSCKQAPLVRDGDVNAAMARAMKVLFTTWQEILDTWERAR